MTILKAVVRGGRVEIVDAVKLPEGAKLLVTLVEDQESDFWLQASTASLAQVWENSEDDIYGRLLQE